MRAMPGRWRPGSIRLTSRSSCCQPIETRRLFVFTHPDTSAAVEYCHELMMQGFAALEEVPQQ